MCENYPERVRVLFDNLDLTRVGERVRAAIKEGDWPLACAALLDGITAETPVRPWERAKSPNGDWKPAGPDNYYVRRGNRILADTIMVNWVVGHVPRTEDGGIDWEWRGPDDDREWAWGLNRHEHLLLLEAAYLGTGDAAYVARIDEELRDWIISSPYPGKKNSSSQWRGLEVAGRVLVWRVLFFQLGREGELSPSTRILMLSSLVDHADYLRRYHADGGNHVVGEMRCLNDIATVWPMFAGSDEWRNYARKVISEQIHEQVYPDGAHTELTSHYHALTAVQFYEFGRATRWQDAESATLVRKMWDYLALTIRPDGTGPLNNNSDLYNMAGVIETVEMPGREMWKYIITHGARGERPQRGPYVVFPWAGHVILRSGWEEDALWSFFDVGPWGTGHQHNDKLHVSVSAFGRDLLVDAGRYTYKDGAWREYFTGSASHNVILIDGHGQGKDRKRADEPISDDDWRIEEHHAFARGTFNAGFDGVRGRVRHTRVLIYVNDSFWVVADRIDTNRPRDIDALWHFHPDCQVIFDGDEAVTVDEEKGNLRIIPVSTMDWHRAQVRGSENPIQGWYSAKFGHKKKNTVVTYSTRITESGAFAWVLLPARGDVPNAEVRLVSVTAQEISLTVEMVAGRWRIDVPLDEGAPSVRFAH